MDLSRDDRELLALHLVPGIGPRLLAALVERFGATTAITRASIAELTTLPYLGEKDAMQLQASLRSNDVDEELELLRAHNVTLIRLGSPDYPAQLATIVTPPRFLYVRGRLLPQDTEAVGVVGSRGCTSYGKRVAERLGRD